MRGAVDWMASPVSFARVGVGEVDDLKRLLSAMESSGDSALRLAVEVASSLMTAGAILLLCLCRCRSSRRRRSSLVTRM